MKKSLRYSIALLTILSLFSSVVFAASIVPAKTVFNFNPGITPAPKVIVPFAQLTTPAVPVADAMKDFKNLSKAEKKERLKAVKAEIKEFKKQKNAGATPSTNTLLLVILAILLPPLAVYLHEGEINNKFWLDLILTLLFFLPGVIYALIVVLGKG